MGDGADDLEYDAIRQNQATKLTAKKPLWPHEHDECEECGVQDATVKLRCYDDWVSQQTYMINVCIRCYNGKNQ